MDDDTWIIDTRNGRKLGPYSPEDAKQLAINLNDFIFRNTGRKIHPWMLYSQQ